MKRIPDCPPLIPQLSPNCTRVLFSVMIPIYNGINYLSEALESVLIQDLGEFNMQIEVVDDCSTDGDVQRLVHEVGRGRVIYYRQPENVGSLRNFETCINRAKGEYVHLLHCDDRVKPGFYKSMSELFLNFPASGAAFCRHEIINSEGQIVHTTVKEREHPCILDNALLIIAERQIIQFASIVVRRKTYEKLGGFFGVTYGEDWEMWARIAQKFTIGYTPEILAQYRRHDNNISKQSFIKGSNFKDISQVLSTIEGYLPDHSKIISQRRAKTIYAWYSIQFVENQYKENNIKRIPFRFYFEAIRFCKDFSIKWYVLKLFIKFMIIRIRRIDNHN